MYCLIGIVASFILGGVTVILMAQDIPNQPKKLDDIDSALARVERILKEQKK